MQLRTIFVLNPVTPFVNSFLQIAFVIRSATDVRKLVLVMRELQRRVTNKEGIPQSILDHIDKTGKVKISKFWLQRPTMYGNRETPFSLCFHKNFRNSL